MGEPKRYIKNIFTIADLIQIGLFIINLGLLLSFIIVGINNKNNAELELRAFIMVRKVTPLKIVANDTNYTVCKYEIINVGKTPALNIVSSTKFAIGKIPLYHIYDSLTNVNKKAVNGFALGPNNSDTRKIQSHFKISKNDSINIVNDKIDNCLMILVSYTDWFGKEHSTLYGVRINVHDSTYRYYRDYNYAN